MFKLLILLMVTTFSYGQCVLENMRVERYDIIEGKTYIKLGNLDFTVGVHPGDDLHNFISQATADYSKDKFYTLTVTDNLCDTLKTNREKRFVGYYAIENFLNIEESDYKPVCIEDITNYNTPTMVMLPSMDKIDEILRESVGFNEEQVDKFQKQMLKTFVNMDPKKREANSIALPIILLENIASLGLKEVSTDQLSYLVSLFVGELSQEEIDLMEQIVDQVDKIEFKEKKGKLKVVLRTQDKQDIQIRAEDVPTTDAHMKQVLAETLHVANIEDKAYIEYTKSDGDIGLKKSVKIRGIDVIGNFPVIGKLKVTPRDTDVNLSHEDTPTKVGVRFLKGIIPAWWTFDLQN